MKEHFGKWQEITRCTECGWTTDKKHIFMSPFFVSVCPGCGTNNVGWEPGDSTNSRLFEPVTARAVRAGIFRRFVRWELKDD